MDVFWVYILTTKRRDPTKNDHISYLLLENDNLSLYTHYLDLDMYCGTHTILRVLVRYVYGFGVSSGYSSG